MAELRGEETEIFHSDEIRTRMFKMLCPWGRTDNRRAAKSLSKAETYFYVCPPFYIIRCICSFAAYASVIKTAFVTSFFHNTPPNSNGYFVVKNVLTLVLKIL